MAEMTETRMTTLPAEKDTGDVVRGLAEAHGVKLSRFVTALARSWMMLSPEQQIRALTGNGSGPSVPGRTDFDPPEGADSDGDEDAGGASAGQPARGGDAGEGISPPTVA